LFFKPVQAAPDGRLRLLQCGKGVHDFAFRNDISDLIAGTNR
jgi:hypothetical protein